ncbi:hypothetical protein HBI44_245580 [Parastagonospora nodorum]|nr:hypothetical protein HBI44_245580 [Parastagonospora nodorum]
MDPANSTLCDPSDPLVVRFCIFSDPALENIGIPTNKEVVEIQTDTATALADKLAAVNKSVRLQTFTLKILEHVETVHWIIAEANMPAVHSEATKHCPALSAARFALVRGFGKVDRHVFRADNTMSASFRWKQMRYYFLVMSLYRGGLYSMNSIIASQRAQSWLSFTRIFESITKDTNRKHGLCPERGSAVDKVTGKHTYKTCNRVYAQWRDVVANVRCSADQFKALDGVRN